VVPSASGEKNAHKQPEPSTRDASRARRLAPSLSLWYDARYPHMRGKVGRRFLVFGARGSGASVFVHALAQTSDAVAIPLLYADAQVPTPEQLDLPPQVDAILRVVPRQASSYAAALSRYRPDVTILFLRHPAHAAAARRRRAAHKQGGKGLTAEDAAVLNSTGAPLAAEMAAAGDEGAAMAALDAAFEGRERMFDAVVHFEHMLLDRLAVAESLTAGRVGIERHAALKMLAFPRRPSEIQQRTLEYCAWCREALHSQWDSGTAVAATAHVTLRKDHVHARPLKTEFALAKAASPLLDAHYAAAFPSLAGGDGKRVLVYSIQVRRRRFLFPRTPLLTLPPSTTQGSGAALFMHLLNQKMSSVGVLDLWPARAPPTKHDLEDTEASDVFMKALTNNKFSLREYVDAFAPDVTILFLRHPAHLVAGLKRKPQVAQKGGSVDDRLALLEEAYAQREGLFDAVVLYEEMVTQRDVVVDKLTALGFAQTDVLRFFNFARSADDVRQHTLQHCAWCKKNVGAVWDIGKARRAKLNVLTATAGAALSADHLNQYVEEEATALLYITLLSLLLGPRARGYRSYYLPTHSPRRCSGTRPRPIARTPPTRARPSRRCTPRGSRTSPTRAGSESSSSACSRAGRRHFCTWARRSPTPSASSTCTWWCCQSCYARSHLHFRPPPNELTRLASVLSQVRGPPRPDGGRL